MRADQQPATKADLQQLEHNLQQLERNLRTEIRSLTTIVERKFTTLDERLTLAGQALAGDTDSWREKVVEEERVGAELNDQ